MSRRTTRAAARAAAAKPTTLPQKRKREEEPPAASEEPALKRRTVTRQPFDIGSQNAAHYGQDSPAAKTTQISQLSGHADLTVLQEISNQTTLRSKLRLPKGKLMLDGPIFRSGSYVEHQPVIYSASTFAKPPNLYYFKDNSTDTTVKIPRRASEEDRTIIFGSQRKAEEGITATGKKAFPARPTSFWKGKLEPDEQGVQRRVIVMNIHTSPSGSLPDQASTIRQQMEHLSHLYPERPVIASGDFYLQRGARKAFGELERSTQSGGEEQLFAAKVSHGRSSGYAQTNFPNTGAGQAADLSIARRAQHATEPLRGHTEVFSAPRGAPIDTRSGVNAEGKRLKKMSIDHVAVRTHVELPSPVGRDGPKNLHSQAKSLTHKGRKG